MSTTLEFGRRSRLQLDLPEETLIAQHARPRGSVLDDAAQSMRSALTSPIGLPSISRMVVPGDRILLAVGDGLPEAPGLLAGAVAALEESGIEPTNVTILQTKVHQKRTNDNLASEITPAVRHQLRLIVHDPKDREQLSYLAASQKHEPIYFNRHICDADFVIPIGCQRPEGALPDLGGCECLFPTFADAATRQRFHSPRSAMSKRSRDARLCEITEAIWLLGVTFFVRVVPGSRGGLLHVLAGTADGVDQRGRELSEAAWRFPIRQKASLVVAGISGGREHQTWLNVARSLSTVLPYVEDDGAVVVCTDLKDRPGRSLRKLAGASSLDHAEQAIQSDRTEDAVPTQLLINALRHVRVYLLSQLEEETVEDLGIAYVSAPDEVSTLTRQHESCIVLADAHQAALSFAEVA